MIKRTFGKTDMQISVIGLGAWAIGGWMWGGQDEGDSIAAIHAALDSEVNWIDTAAIYGGGYSEEVVAKALRDIPADKRPLIFTKFGLGTDTDAMRRSAAYQEVLDECDASLQRLGIDCIDYYQQHWPVEQPVEEAARACDELMKAGKIRYVGVSNFNVEQMQAWQATGLPLHGLQTPLNVLKQASTEEIIPYCCEQELGCIAYSPLYRGMLFGKWQKDRSFPEGDSRNDKADFQGERLNLHIAAVDQIATVAADFDMDCAQLCIGIILCNPGLTGCIVGARNAAQGACLGELGLPAKTKAIEAVEKIVEALNQQLDALSE